MTRADVSGASDLRRIVAARFLSRAGSEGAFFIGVWGKAAYELHGTPAQLALVMFAVSLAAIAGSTAGGVLVDRHGPRRVLAAAEILFIPAAIAMAFASTFAQLTAIAAVWAFVGAPVVTAGASFAPFLVSGGADLKRTNAFIEGAGSAAFVIGPALGAVVVHYSSTSWVFAIDALTSLMAAALVWRVHIVRPAAPPEHVDRHPLSELADGLRASYGIRAVRYYVLAGTVTWLGFGAFGALEPLFFRDVVHTGVETIGWVNTLFGIGMIAGAALLRRLPSRVLAARWLAGFVALTGLGALLYVGSADLRLIAAGAVVWGGIIGLTEPLTRTLLHRDAPQHIVGRIMGTAEVHRRVGELLPLALAPAAAAAFGVQPTLIAGGLAVAIVALASLPEAAAIDRGPIARFDVVIEPFTAAEEPVSPNP